MLALDARFRRPRPARPPRPSDPSALLHEAGEPAAFPPATSPAVGATPAPTAFTTAPVLVPTPAVGRALAPTGEARMLRRVRRVVRRRLRVDLAGLLHASVSDGDLGVRIETVSPRDPHLMNWTADRQVALVVLHDGCGSRVLGGGGLAGSLELPSIACSGAFLAFCYDAVAGTTRS